MNNKQTCPIHECEMKKAIQISGSHAQHESEKLICPECEAAKRPQQSSNYNPLDYR